MHDAAEITERFIRAVAAQDFSAWSDMVDPAIVMMVPYAPGDGSKVTEGSAECEARQRRVYGAFRRFVWTRLDISASADGTMAFGLAESDTELLSGKPYSNRYCFVARLRDGRIYEFSEYFDPLAVMTAFGMHNPAHGTVAEQAKAATSGNRDAALRFFEAISNSDFVTLEALMTDDVSWWSGGDGQLPGSGTLHGAAVTEAFQAIIGRFRDGLHMTVKRTLCEDDIVVAEVESHAVTTDGAVYHNKYLFLLRFENERLAEGREYSDTLHVRRTLFPDGI